MRLSVNEDDPGYSPRAILAKAYLDGVELKNCITADEEQGLAIVYAEGPPGDELGTEERRGVVRIVLPEEPT